MSSFFLSTFETEVALPAVLVLEVKMGSLGLSAPHIVHFRPVLPANVHCVHVQGVHGTSESCNVAAMGFEGRVLWSSVDVAPSDKGSRSGALPSGKLNA